MEQQTVDWHKWRSEGIGASDAPVIMEVSPWATPHELWQEKTGRLIKNRTTWATQRGNDMEPRARAKLELMLDIEFPATLAEHPSYTFIRASLDGWNQEKKIVLEIKCPGAEDHAKAEHGEIPAKYFPQLQQQLFVTGANKLFYYSYSENVHKIGNGFLVEVFPDKEYQKKLFDKLCKFWKCVTDDIEPDLIERDYKLIRNADLLSDLISWKETSDNLKVLEKRLETMKAKILSHEKVKDSRVRCGNFKIGFTSRKGNVDYKKIPELKEIDLEQYRGKTTTYQTISYKEGENE